jgi:copper chaperone CopZ
MPESIFEIEQLVTPDDAEAVMIELQDLPCVNQADVDLSKRQAWVSHTSMISPEDIATALENAGYTSKLLEK